MQSQRCFNDVFGFRPRDQHIRRDAEFATVEFLNSRDLLRRLALKTLMQVAPIVDPPNFF